MVQRHYCKPHRFICVTDDPEGLADGIEHVPIWDDHRYIPNPTGGGRPGCYLRLKMFDPDISQLLGDRFVMLDLDCVIVGDLSPIFDRTDDVVLWKSPAKEWPYNGAMQMMNAGARPQVWKDFDPKVSPGVTHARGYRGSDQAWISHKLGWDEAVWSESDGVYYLGALKNRHVLPDNAKIVFTTGGNAPWTLPYGWVKANYQ